MLKATETVAFFIPSCFLAHALLLVYQFIDIVKNTQSTLLDVNV